MHTGTVNEPGPYYGFFSGFGSDLGEYTLVFTLLGSIWRAEVRHREHMRELQKSRNVVYNKSRKEE